MLVGTSLNVRGVMTFPAAREDLPDWPVRESHDVGQSAAFAADGAVFQTTVTPLPDEDFAAVRAV